MDTIIFPLNVDTTVILYYIHINKRVYKCIYVQEIYTNKCNLLNILNSTFLGLSSLHALQLPLNFLLIYSAHVSSVKCMLIMVLSCKYFTNC